MMRRNFFVKVLLVQAAVAVLTADLKKNNKDDLSEGTNTALRLSRRKHRAVTSWKKEPHCINKNSDCRCPISAAYKDSPAPRCSNINKFDGCGRRVCYYNNKAHMRSAETKGQPDLPYYVFEAPGCLCTHLVYGFALVDSDLTTPSSINLLWPYANDVPCAYPCKGRKQRPNHDHPGMVNCMKHAKKTNPSLRTILGVGGNKQNNQHFSYMLQTPENRKIFIADVKETLKTFDLQGIDIYMPFHGIRCNRNGNVTECGQNKVDKYRFTSFLKELRQAVPPELSVTATVSCHPHLMHSAYQPEKIIYHVDWLNLMTFHLNDGFDQQTRHPSRLNPEFDGDHANVKWCVQHWTESAWKADPSRSNNILKQIKRKLVLGLNLFPSFYKLSRPNSIRENSTELPHKASLSPAQLHKDTDEEDNMSSITGPPQNASISPSFSPAQVDNNSTEEGSVSSTTEPPKNTEEGNNMSSVSNLVPTRDDEKVPPQNISFGPAQLYTKTQGYMTYYELCKLRQKNFLVDSRLDEREGGNPKEKSGQEPIAQNPWAYITYEDAVSLRRKVQYATNVEDLGGVMIWDITADDFRGDFCQQGNHPLLHAITDSCLYERLTPKPEVVVSPDPQCGDRRAAPSGSGYQQLVNGRWIDRPCAEGTAFSTISCVCDWPQGSSPPPARQRPPMPKSKSASKAGSVWRVSGLRAATTLAVALMAATLAPW